MRELGQELLRKRLELGIDLDELEARTKIRKRYLVALEEGDWGVLPGTVYARGFVRSYAEVVGLDGKALLSYYDSAGGSASNVGAAPEGSMVDPPRTQQPKSESSASFDSEPIFAANRHSAADSRANRPVQAKPQRPAKQWMKRTGRRKAGLSQGIAVVAALVILGGGWYMLRSPHGGSGAVNNETALGGSSNLQQNGSNQAAVGNQQTPANSAATMGNTAANQTAAPTPTSSTSIVAEPFQNGAQTFTVKTSGSMTVQLVAGGGDCWVSVTSDHNIVDGNDMVRQGQQRIWSAGQSISIIVGNVPAVTISVNGQTVPLPVTNNPLTLTFVKQSG